MKRCAFIVLLSLGATSSVADVITYSISTSNTALSSCCTGPYGGLWVDLTSPTTADIHFRSDTNAGYLYLFGDSGAAALNVNAATFTAIAAGYNSLNSYLSRSDQFRGSIPDVDRSGGVDTFGNFNLIVNLEGGFAKSATLIEIHLEPVTKPPLRRSSLAKCRTESCCIGEQKAQAYVKPIFHQSSCAGLIADKRPTCESAI